MTWKEEILTELGLPMSPDYFTAVDRYNDRLKAEEDAQRVADGIVAGLVNFEEERHKTVLAKMRKEILAEVAKLQGNI